MIKEVPDLYLDEIAAKMTLRTGKSVSIATIWRALKYCGITHKKVCLSFIFVNNIKIIYLFYLLTTLY